MTRLAADPEIVSLAATCAVAPPTQTLTGRQGEMFGRDAGSSIEFQEFREYAPGDDVRRIDWAAYARTESLMVRRFRDEVSPAADVVLDTSASMAVHGGVKGAFAKRLAAFFMLAFQRLGGRPRLVLFGGEGAAETADVDALARLDDVAFTGRGAFEEVFSGRVARFRKNAFRVVISDLLFEHDPQRFVRQAFGDAAVGCLVQTLATWEADPSPAGGRRLIDEERSEGLELVLDAGRIARYRARLDALKRDLAAASRRRRTVFVSHVVERGLTRLCRGPLVESGLLRPV